MKQGTIKNLGKTYGFIDYDGRDVFLHSHNLGFRLDKLSDGDIVEFREAKDHKGRPEAVDVKLVKKSISHPLYFRS